MWNLFSFSSSSLLPANIKRPEQSLGHPGVSVAKNPPANAGNVGSVSGFRRSPGEGNGNSLPNSCLENTMDTEAWQTSMWQFMESQRVVHDLVTKWQQQSLLGVGRRKRHKKVTAFPLPSRFSQSIVYLNFRHFWHELDFSPDCYFEVPAFFSEVPMEGQNIRLKSHPQSLQWVRLHLLVCPSGHWGGMLVKPQSPVTLSSFKPQSEWFSYKSASLLLVMGFHLCLFIDFNLISQKYFTSLIKIKIREKNRIEEIPGNSHSLCYCSSRFFFSFFLFFKFWPHDRACGILVPQPGTEPIASTLEVQRLNHSTTRGSPFLQL